MLPELVRKFRARWSAVNPNPDPNPNPSPSPNQERYVPHVIEPSIGVDRLMLAVLTSAYCTDEVGQG